MHYKIIIQIIKYSFLCNGFKYLALYIFSLVLYLISFYDAISKFVTIILSVMALFASLLSDNVGIKQLINAYKIVGLRSKDIFSLLEMFVAIRRLIIIIIYVALSNYICAIIFAAMSQLLTLYLVYLMRGV